MADMDIAQGIFDFAWPVCRDGYQLIDCAPDGYKSMLAVKAVSVDPNDYEWKGSERLLDAHRALLNAEPSPEGALSFVSRYGVLRAQRGPIDLDEIPNYEVSTLDELMKFKRQIEPFMREPDKHYEDVTAKFNERFDVPLFEVRFTDLKAGEVRLVPTDLRAFIILLVANDLSGDIEWRSCANPKCDKTFAVQTKPRRDRPRGVGTMRKVTCGAARCQQAIARMKRAQSVPDAD